MSHVRYYIIFIIMPIVYSTENYTNSTFYAYDNYGYSLDNLYCVDYVDCLLNCYGGLSCIDLTIFGPKDATLTINCDSRYESWSQSCTLMTVHAEESIALYMNIFNTRQHSPWEMANSKIYTPLPRNGGNQVRTCIRCGIIGPFNSNSSGHWPTCAYGNSIYSQNGWSSVIFSYVEPATWSLQNDDNNNNTGLYAWKTMFCGNNYEHSCVGWNVDDIYYRCANRSSVCDYDRNVLGPRNCNITTDAPTTNTTAPTTNEQTTTKPTTNQPTTTKPTTNQPTTTKPTTNQPTTTKPTTNQPTTTKPTTNQPTTNQHTTNQHTTNAQTTTKPTTNQPTTNTPTINGVVTTNEENISITTSTTSVSVNMDKCGRYGSLLSSITIIFNIVWM
eukprot:544481_1